jgi:5'-3' exonuclease
MILIDYSQVCVAAILAFSADIKKNSTGDKKDLIRHVALSSIKAYKKKYGKDYGDIVICCDGRNYWRREFFQQYKGMRKKAREASDLDWSMIFDTLSEIREDLKEHFNYKVIHLDRCEADDVIAILAESTQEFGRHESVMIVSSDKDFKQLHTYDNVKQFSPMLKKQIVINKKELHAWLIEHIVKGDSGDGIPNILSKDDTLVSGERQKPVSAKRLQEFIDNGFIACKTEEERRNWHRNVTLVDFKFIPTEIKNTVLEAYEEPAKGNKAAIMNYLIKNRCRLLLNEIEDF